MIAITEAHIDEDYDMTIKDYAVHKNCRDLYGGGIVIAVRKELKYVAVEVKRSTEYLESLWVLVNNTKVKIRIGVVYFPQERDQNLKEIYNIIKEQVRKAGANDESVFIVGDFNCRVGGKIKNNEGKASKSGEKMLKMIEKEGLVLVNSMENCKGTWTREENGSRSILDYVLVDEELGSYIKEVEIHDKNKDISPFHLKREPSNKIRMIYSDHNPIVVKSDLILMQRDTTEKKKRLVLTKEGREKYHNELQQKEISKMWDGVENLEEAYENWETTVMESRRKYEQVRKPTFKRRSKTMRLLMMEKKKIKKGMTVGMERTEKIQELKEKILEEEQESYYRKLQKTCEEIRVDGKFSSGGFWKMRKRMKRKKDEEIHAVEDKEGKLLTSMGK